MDKVLIVDDNVQNCDILEDVISTWGYEVYKAYNGKEAIEIARKFRPNVILLDVMLPGMNGFEVCNILKNDPRTLGTPIAMLTVLDEVEDRIRGFKVGADLFMSKPINYEELKIRLESLINWQKRFENMETQENVIKAILNIVKILDYKLYENIQIVRKYVEKMSSNLAISANKQKKLAIAALLSEIGRIAKNPEDKDYRITLEILRPLKLNSWLDQYIINSLEWSDSLSDEYKVLIMAKYFVKMLDSGNTKEQAMEIINIEYKQGKWDQKIIKSLEIALEDEKFIDKFMI